MITNTEKDALKQYFENRNDIAFAFLYGSQAHGYATRLSDVDIAVYFYPRERRPIEYESENNYDGEDEIWGDLERFLKKEVELLVLNRAAATVAASAIRGIPLAINDWGLYLDFMLVITDVAIDFTELIINDYKERQALEK
ncbi:MAG TPA: nucleotidyltransferase domain-containing protein [bacterium]